METGLIANKAELQTRIGAIVRQAHDILVESDSDVQTAAEMTRAIKSISKSVTEQYEPMRVQAKAAYDAVLTEKSSFIKPLDEAEKTLKGKIVRYDEIKRRKAEEESERLRAMAAEEAAKKAQEAAQAEQSGDFIGAEMARLEADALQATAQSASIINRDADVDGMSRRRSSYRIKSVDPTKVPIEWNGVVIRPVDERAVLGFIRDTKGKVQIPGIEFEEVTTIVIR